MKKRLVIFALLLFFLSPFLWPFFGYRITEYFQRERFDSEVWKKEPTLTDPVRIRMVDDLLWRHRLIGMTREEVVDLLGEPKGMGYFEEYDLVYWLGPERGFMSIDSEWLVLRLDSGGKVSLYRIVTD